MKRAIVCEGKTDAIILGLFLESYGWNFLRKDKRPFDLRIDEINQTVEWYANPARPGEELVIWGAGGIDRIGNAIFDVIERTRTDPNQSTRFTKIAVVFDRDDRDNIQNAEVVMRWAANSNLNVDAIGLGGWNTCSMILNGSKRENHLVELLPIAIPLDEPGDLELFLQSAIRNMSPADDLLVTACVAFISSQPNDPYLMKQRLRSKAAMGTMLSVISPDWVFGDLIQKLRQVQWQTLGTVQTAFKSLANI